MQKLTANQAKFQIGKSGLTDGVINSISLMLKTHKQVRVSVLKSAAEERSNLEEIAEKIKSKLEYRVTIRIIGFTIIITKLK